MTDQLALIRRVIEDFNLSYDMQRLLIALSFKADDNGWFIVNWETEDVIDSNHGIGEIVSDKQDYAYLAVKGSDVFGRFMPSPDDTTEVQNDWKGSLAPLL